MRKMLVIVESPAKAKTINQYLGKDYVVKSSLGHIRDLPTSSKREKKNLYSSSSDIVNKNKKDIKKSLVSRMGIDPFNNWKANYRVLPGKEKVVSSLQILAEQSDLIYLATDLDREGEAIAWHLQEVIGGDKSRYKRVVFNEITKNSICQAFNNPSVLNINRVYAQQARRFMDRIVGYMVSPVLWKKIARGLSAGRVQSVAVRLVVEREREIKSFSPTEYWLLYVELATAEGVHVRMQVTHQLKKVFSPSHRSQINVALGMLEVAYFIVTSCEDKYAIRNPSAPFITSTLQQAASTQLSFSVHHTMVMAQFLYEAGYITYMRTDSTNLSQDSLIMVRNYIKTEFGEQYLPQENHIYNSGERSHEAHEAIRPSDVEILFSHLHGMPEDAKKLYKLIWSQFVSCQMISAIYNTRTLIVEAANFTLKTKERILCFDGWTRLLPVVGNCMNNIVFPLIGIGSVLILQNLVPTQRFTKPPVRFSEALLVRDLEKRGIGRPSTYASIISTIQQRGYVRVENRRFYSEKIGEIVTDRLIDHFTDLMDYNFTAHMEDSLDQVAHNKIEWKEVLDNFFRDFSKNLEKAEMDPEIGGMKPNKIVLTSIECPLCRGQMGIRTAATGVFLGCSSYTLPSTVRCKQTINLIPDKIILNNLDHDKEENRTLHAIRHCILCNTIMDCYLIDDKNKIYICGQNPACNGYEIQSGKFQIEGYKELLVSCERCSSEMSMKIGRYGKYMDCLNAYCKNTRKVMKNGKLAPPKSDPVPLPELRCQTSDAYFVLRQSASGIFLAANTFPKSRETRSPKVEELRLYRDRLPETLHYLANAPTIDREGNKSIVCFSRKNKTQYVRTERNGKKTGWFAYFIDGQWKEVMN
ncbi:type I DNA topoisomerase [Candidatus Erwinia haradaeae]|uniref:DNA topoisomerase 1 n=1 Tax=Candidatus Erwinia haradaeae TaxID=1922217 RepID=A0A803GCN7_9GAMM|nr:type I DNA topoisomerase [Candidatus Erwinia haradaeae]VFP87964.1 DNA topoisomerase 1 [Candidatus Erwinia haradaeae]